MAGYVNWSCVVAPEGRLLRPTMYMSKNWMDNVWSWDHCFNALALVYKNPALAWDQFMVMFDAQDEFGALPDYINDIEIVWNFLKPPIHGWALKRMLERTDSITEDHLAEAYDPLCRWTNWWLEYRDTDGDGCRNTITATTRVGNATVLRTASRSKRRIWLRSWSAKWTCWPMSPADSTKPLKQINGTSVPMTCWQGCSRHSGEMIIS